MEPPLPIESFMLYETYTHTVQPYAYCTENHHTRMVRTVRVYAYGMKYVYGTQHIPYSGKVWRGESLANLANRRRFAKLKPSKLISTIDNPLADPFIRQTFFRQTLKNSRFAKHYARQTFPLYGI